VNDRDRQRANAREDERNRYTVQQRLAKQEAAIRANERHRMQESRNLVDRTDDTGFAPDALI
jgi:hypothetical protein